MRRAVRILGRLALVLVPLVLGVAVLVRAVSDREPPVSRERQEAVTAARVITMEPAIFAPEVSAFGSVEPASTWRALAQVAGEVARLDPDLRPGRLVEAGTELIRIDATDYELAEAQAVSRLAGAGARLAELAAREQNLEASLAIEHRALALAEEDLERRQTLLQRTATSQASVDQAEEAVLQKRARAQEMENSLNLVPAQKSVQEAEKAIAQSQLAEARRNIERTRIVMPFDGRISDLDVERGQFVSAGQLMLVAEGIAAAEVSASLRLDQLETLVDDNLKLASVVDLSVGDLDAVPRGLDLTAELRMILGSRVVTWPAAIRRASFALEPETRTIALVVGVDDPFRHAIPGERPPLVKGMFVEVVVRGATKEGVYRVPREALERAGDGGWFVRGADADDRLRSIPVTLDGVFGNVALITAGLQAGDRVVVSELSVAIEGMRLDPREDVVLKGRLDGRSWEASK
jgi:multidrug efflux pump subunit AcrA (membrane-fusion protein)